MARTPSAWWTLGPGLRRGRGFWFVRRRRERGGGLASWPSTALPHLPVVNRLRRRSAGHLCVLCASAPLREIISSARFGFGGARVMIRGLNRKRMDFRSSYANPATPAQARVQLPCAIDSAGVGLPRNGSHSFRLVEPGPRLPRGKRILVRAEARRGFALWPSTALPHPPAANRLRWRGAGHLLRPLRLCATSFLPLEIHRDDVAAVLDRLGDRLVILGRVVRIGIALGIVGDVEA